MPADHPTLRRLSAGLYRHEPTGRYIVSRVDEGPRGGRIWLWEIASRDTHTTALIQDGALPFHTLREAMEALDAR